MAGGTIAVEGLQELIRTTARIDKQAAGELRKTMKTDVGAPFVLDVKARISSNGLVRSGRLRSSIRSAVQGSTLVVRSSPPLRPGNHSPVGYAAIYEFGGSNVRSIKLKGGGRGFGAVKNRSAQGSALRSSGGAQGSLGEFGPRAFLYPTLEEWGTSGKTEEHFGKFLDWVDDEWGGASG